MSSKELKLASKVEKKQKRRQEKDAKKKLKREKEEREKEERKRLKKLEKKQKKEKKKEQKEQKKREGKRERELNKSDKLVKLDIPEKSKPTDILSSIDDKAALQFLATFSTEPKHEKKHKKDYLHKDKKQEEISSDKKPKLKNVKKHIITTDHHFKPTVSVDSVKPVQVTCVNSNIGVPTPVATPVPQPKINSIETDNNSTLTIMRIPVSIRTPGARRKINPIYTRPVVNNTNGNGDFIIPGVNDTEESKILTRTFADKWYLPANLYKIEANTGLKYKRGRFSDSEKLLAMKLTTKFCQEQNMTLERFKTIFFDDMGTENGHQNRLSNFFVDVSQHFGGRPVVAVYDCLKRLYHPGNHRGSWTSEEDQILLREYQKHGPKWTLIGKELNRLGINCRDRYNVRWKHVDTAASGPWTSEEDKKLTSAIKKSIETSGTISWLWIAEESVKTRTPLQCVKRWKHLKEKSAKEFPVFKKTKEYWNGWKEDEDYLLIHSILISGATTDDSIQWKNLTVTGIPASRHNPEFFFRRWNHLKAKAEISSGCCNLKENVEKIKKYLINLSKSPAYIFSEDEDDDI